MKWGARAGGGERSREEGRGGRRREEGAGGRIPSCEVDLDTIQVALLNEYLILNSELDVDLSSQVDLVKWICRSTCTEDQRART